MNSFNLSASHWCSLCNTVSSTHHTALCRTSSQRRRSLSRKSMGFHTGSASTAKITLNAAESHLLRVSLRCESPWQSLADVWNPRARSRATLIRGRATAGPPAQPSHGQWSSWCHLGLMGSSYEWCTAWWSDLCRGSRRSPSCSSSPEEKTWAAETSPVPDGHSFFLNADRGRD